MSLGAQMSSDDAKATLKSRKQENSSGYTKNVTPFVFYNPLIDEKSLNLCLDGKFLTNYTKNYKKPPASYTTGRCGVLVDSSFTRLPLRIDVADHRSHISTTAANYARSLTLKSPDVAGGVIPSESAFTVDVEHIMTLGTNKDERFPKFTHKKSQSMERFQRYSHE